MKIKLTFEDLGKLFGDIRTGLEKDGVTITIDPVRVWWEVAADPRQQDPKIMTVVFREQAGA
jgi:hypothetical protein